MNVIHPSETPTAKPKKILYKIVVLGNSSVGKTSFLERYVHGKFSNNYKSTLGIDFLSKPVDRNGKQVTLQLWDTSSGRERFQSLTKAYYRGADAFFLIYDITNERSFKDALVYPKEITNYIQGTKPCIILVGSKKDLAKDRNVSTVEAMEIAKDQIEGCHVCEISSKTGEGIDELMELCISTIENNQKMDNEIIESPLEAQTKKPVSYFEALLNWFVSWWQ